VATFPSISPAPALLAGARLTILTEGDFTRGLGHIARCTGFADLWREWGGSVAWFVDGDAAARRLLEGEPASWGRWHRGPAPAALAGGAVLVDSYTADAATLAAIARLAGSVLYLDDGRGCAYPPGLAVDGTPGATAPGTGAAAWALGPDWHPMRRAFWDVPPRARAADEVGRILLLSGGTDLRGLAPVALDAALAVFPDATIDLVLGAGAPAPSSPLPPSATVHRDIPAEALRELMRAADLAVSAAGQTLCELARCGTPTLAVAVASNQERNLAAWSALGAALSADRWSEPDLAGRLRAGLARLAPRESRARAAAVGPPVIDGQGTRRLALWLAETAAEPQRLGA